MRLFKYLIISNELIDPHSIYLISPSEKQGKKDNPKTTILNINTIDDYINDKLIEIKHNKTYKYREKQIVDFYTNASYEFKISNIDKIKSRYQAKVKGLAERSCETIKTNMFINRYLLPSSEAKYNAQSVDDILLNKQIYLNIESYFSKYGFKVNDLNIGSSVLDQNSIVFCFDKDYRKISIETLTQIASASWTPR